MKKIIGIFIVYFIAYAAVLMLMDVVLASIEKRKIENYRVESYEVVHGDTYDILAEYFDITEDKRDWRERVKKLNGKEDSCLYAGEMIYVLVEKGEQSRE